MKRIKVLFRWFIMFSIIRCFGIQSFAEEVSVQKSALPYEILTVETNQTSMIIKGWALISYVQHFQDASDHSVQLEFVSIYDSFKVDANLEPISQTTMMQYFGTPTCSWTSIHIPPETCNFIYENVGFSVEIPLDRFQATHHYQTNIIVNAFAANLSFKTPLYYPIPNDLSFRIEEKEYRIVSRLDDTQLKVSATTVIARKEPYKSSPAWFSGANCSATYTNQLFFMKDTIYTSIKQKIMVGNTSYYGVSANPYLCYSSRRRIIEGNSLNPVWIASPYVLYSGSPLQIQVIRLNNLPVLSTGTIQVVEGESVNVFDHVSAYDIEDGDISSNIKIISNNIQSIPGSYRVDLSVTDSFGSTSYGTLFVNVITLPNIAPIIEVKDKTVLQHSTFDPRKDVKASDYEDGDLTESIEVIGAINTAIIGTQTICYQVYDSKSLSSNACIIVNVIDFANYSNRFRFISKTKPFYMENIPHNWINNINSLISVLENTEIIQTVDIY